MEDKMKYEVGRYWALFYQPLPESGERIAIALVFEDKKRHATIEYDNKFSKILALFPNTDSKVLAFYLDNIRSDLNRSNDPEAILNAYAPQFWISRPRRLSVPMSDNTLKMLVARYIYSEKRPKQPRQKRDGMADVIKAFVQPRINADVLIYTGVSARDVLGQSVAGTQKIALGIRTDTGWTLIDGVDLNQLTPNQVITRADDVSRTFWNYGRLASDRGIQIKRVGVVLNGKSHLATNTHEAHDYALHRFSIDSDAAIDAASFGADQQLREALEYSDFK